MNVSILFFNTEFSNFILLLFIINHHLCFINGKIKAFIALKITKLLKIQKNAL